jgi:hypothetical protein
MRSPAWLRRLGALVAAPALLTLACGANFHPRGGMSTVTDLPTMLTKTGSKPLVLQEFGYPPTRSTWAAVRPSCTTSRRRCATTGTPSPRRRRIQGCRSTSPRRI